MTDAVRRLCPIFFCRRHYLGWISSSLWNLRTAMQYPDSETCQWPVNVIYNTLDEEPKQPLNALMMSSHMTSKKTFLSFLFLFFLKTAGTNSSFVARKLKINHLPSHHLLPRLLHGSIYYSKKRRLNFERLAEKWAVPLRHSAGGSGWHH